MDVQELIQHAIDEKPVNFDNEFSALVAARAQELVANKKIEIAQNLFGTTVVSIEPDVEDEEFPIDADSDDDEEEDDEETDPVAEEAISEEMSDAEHKEARKGAKRFWANLSRRQKRKADKLPKGPKKPPYHKKTVS